MLRALTTGLLVVSIGCGRSPQRSGEPPATPPGGDTTAQAEIGLVDAGTLVASGVLLGILDDPPRVWQHSASGDRSWPAPARIGAVASGAQPAEVIVAAAWPEARLPRAEVWWLVNGVEQRHCMWQQPAAEHWRAQPRGASSVLPVSGGAVVAGVDGSLVRFDASCAVTVLHADHCCEDEQPLRLRGDAGAWSAFDLHGQRVYPAGNAATCVPVVDATTVRGDDWSVPLPAGITDVRALDWSESCDVVLVAAGTHAWTCRVAGCTRIR